MDTGMSVSSLANQRKKHDDGKCWHDDCAGLYRVLCPYRGEHPDPRCPHPETYMHTFKLHGFLDYEIEKCRRCGLPVYRDSAGRLEPW